MLKEKAGLLLGIALAYDALSDEPAPSARQAHGTGSKARILRHAHHRDNARMRAVTDFKPGAMLSVGSPAASPTTARAADTSISQPAPNPSPPRERREQGHNVIPADHVRCSPGWPCPQSLFH